MSSDLWMYLNNPFDSVTKNSFKKMNLLSTDHHDRLLVNISDPDIDFLYQRFVPLYQKFKNLYQQSISISGLYQGNTMRVENGFKSLSSEQIKRWDIKIQNEYLDDTPEYKMLLPDGRKPFQSGGYESRIRETKALSLRLQEFPMLNHVQRDVDVFITDLETARTKQQGFEKQAVDISSNLEEARLALAKMMQANFARLIDKHIENLEYVQNYYEMQYLRSNNTSTDAEDTNLKIGVAALPSEVVMDGGGAVIGNG